MSARILYVEDDDSLAFVTKDNLQLEGYDVTHCATGQLALQQIKRDAFDIAILDVMLPEIDGFDLAREIRQRNTDVPILFLTAKSLKEDKIKGLKIGGDDYIIKPFSIEELLLKVEIFLRRSPFGEQTDQAFIIIGEYELLFNNLTLKHSTGERTLTEREAELLRLFILNKNKVLKRATILEKIWGENDYFYGRSLDVFISRLRKYLSNDPTLKIENIHGVGFCLKKIEA